MKLTRSFRRTRQTIYRGLMLMLAVAMAITSQMSLAEQGKSEKRVAIVTDTSTHLGPWVARELAQRNHNLVIGTPAEGLAEELRAMGAEVEVVTGVEDLTDPASIKKLVQAAVKRFGGFDAAMIRSGMHLTGDIFQATPEDMQASFEGNTMSVFYALQEILSVLVKQGRGGAVGYQHPRDRRPTLRYRFRKQRKARPGQYAGQNGCDVGRGAWDYRQCHGNQFYRLSGL